MTLEILTADTLAPVRHGFFTRKGGASSGIFFGLNCGVGSSDQREVVQINRARVADAMDAPIEHLVGVHQVHSADVVTVNDPNTVRPKADAMVTNVPGVVLSILTADCQPVLFADAEAGVVGAAHAGWRGALDGVLEATLDAMVALVADPRIDLFAPIQGGDGQTLLREALLVADHNAYHQGQLAMLRRLLDLPAASMGGDG